MDFKLLTSIDDIKKLEELRFEVLHMDKAILDDSIILKEASENKLLAFALFYEDELAAGAYVSDSRNSIYINYVFVKEKYQEKGLKLGRNLILHILKNKNIIEEYFGKQFNLSYLEPRGEKPSAVFKKIGYKETNNILGEYRKVL